MFDVVLKTVFTKVERALIRKNKKFSLSANLSSTSDDSDNLPRK